MKICILYGGLSSEREVSLNTGKSIYYAICDDYDIIMHDWDDDYQSMYNVVKNIDLVFIALHGGGGEDGTMQRYLESKNIKFTGSDSRASQDAMDKDQAKMLCQEHNIPTPLWTLNCYGEGYYTDITGRKSIAEKFISSGFVVKPVNEGSSLGITIFKKYPSEDEFLKSLHKTFTNISHRVMLEEYIDGRELTVSILNNKVLPIIEIVPKADYYDYKCKYTKFQSDYVVPAEIDKKTQELLSAYSLKIHKLIGCGAYSRVDFRLSNDGKIYFLEINTLPGFTDTSLFPKSAAAYGLGYRELIKKIIEIT